MTLNGLRPDLQGTLAGWTSSSGDATSIIGRNIGRYRCNIESSISEH